MLSRKQTSLPKLVKTRADKHDEITRLELWAWVFDAIANDVLRPDLPEGQSLDIEFDDIGGMRKLEPLGNGVVIGRDPWTLRKLLRKASRETKRYILLLEKWAEALMYDTTEFDSWLQKELLAHQIPASQKRRGGRKKKRDRVVPFIQEHYSGNLPAGGNKEIAQKLGVSERTVRRGLGRK
jgi:hypothetical protein